MFQCLYHLLHDERYERLSARYNLLFAANEEQQKECEGLHQQIALLESMLREASDTIERLKKD